jgi:hypothetical protein
LVYPDCTAIIPDQFRQNLIIRMSVNRSFSSARPCSSTSKISALILDCSIPTEGIRCRSEFQPKELWILHPAILSNQEITLVFGGIWWLSSIWKVKYKLQLEGSPECHL